MRRRSVSLRIKFLMALLAVPVVGLSLFLGLARNIFERDKQAYIFDSALAVTKTRAARVQAEFSSALSLAQSLVLSYRTDTRNLSEIGTYIFDHDERFESFQLWAWNAETSAYEKTVDLVKPSVRDALSLRAQWVDSLVTSSRNESRTVSISGLPGASGRVLAFARFGDVLDPKHVIAAFVVHAPDLAANFLVRSSISSYLYNRGQKSLIFEPSWLASDWQSVADKIAEFPMSEGTEEISAADGASAYLASFADVGIGDLMVISMVDQRVALSASQMLLRKSVIFFVALIAFTAILAVLISAGLTHSLSRLTVAASRIAAGDFSARVDLSSRDEIGELTTSFNSMAIEISRLIEETAEKARMQNELATAKTVQETLFPNPIAEFGSVELAGYYKPASECGGDWWFYTESDERILIWIGDATGHGAPAALMTSAARAVASVIEGEATLSVGQTMGLLNRAIHDSSKGRMMMTFFLAGIDKRSGRLTYANASHEPPLLIQGRTKQNEKLDLRNFVVLDEGRSPRLGEQRDQVYKELTYDLKAGDTLVFYTDGIVEAKSDSGQTFGERRLVKSVIAELNSLQDPPSVIAGVVKRVDEFRAGQVADDDVTMVICRFKGFEKPTDQGVV